MNKEITKTFRATLLLSSVLLPVAMPLTARSVAGIGAIATLVGTVAAQTIMVVGTGDPNVDVPAVQAAVDQGGRVVLTGHFSFDRPPTAPTGAIYSRMVTVSKSLVISGGPDQNGDMAAIEGGGWPFFIDAVDARVTIQGLHFIQPKAGAIWVYAVSGLTVTGCRVQSVVPTAEFGTQGGQVNPVSAGIFIGADPHPPNATQLGKPENFLRNPGNPQQ